MYFVARWSSRHRATTKISLVRIITISAWIISVFAQIILCESSVKPARITHCANHLVTHISARIIPVFVRIILRESSVKPARITHCANHLVTPRRYANQIPTWTSDLRGRYFAWNGTIPVVMLATVVETTATSSPNSCKSTTVFWYILLPFCGNSSPWTTCSLG